MAGNSLQSLSQKLAERQATDLERIEAQTRTALEKHAETLSELSSAARAGIAIDLELLRATIRQTTDAMRQASAELAKQTAETLGAHTQELKQETEAARSQLRLLLRRSLLPLAVVWGLAIAGVLVAVGSWWWVTRTATEVRALATQRDQLRAYRGAAIVQSQGRSYLVAPQLGPSYQTKDGMAVQINPE